MASNAVIRRRSRTLATFKSARPAVSAGDHSRLAVAAFGLDSSAFKALLRRPGGGCASSAFRPVLQASMPAGSQSQTSPGGAFGEEIDTGRIEAAQDLADLADGRAEILCTQRGQRLARRNSKACRS
jgi:hypothetical protein